KRSGAVHSPPRTFDASIPMSTSETQQSGPPKGLGPLAKREMRFAYLLLLPTFLIVLSVVLFPLIANVWISFKPVTLGDLRPPAILVNERLMGDLEVAGDEADIRYRARNSSRKSAIADVVFTDTVPASSVVRTSPRAAGSATAAAPQTWSGIGGWGTWV
ncbi:MAG: hypothetical protein AAF547_04525, partial [Actinomycetota bacterium]